MKNWLLVFMMFVVAQAFSQAKKTIDVPDFSAIYVNSDYTVYLKQTNEQQVVLEAIPEIAEVTNIFVEEGILMINVERKPDNQNKSVWAKIDDIKLRPTMKVYVTVRNVSVLQVNGGGKIISENSLAANDLKLLVSGPGSMDLDIKGDQVSAEVSGAGTLGLKGYATDLDARVSGQGALSAFNCPVKSAKIHVSGSGAGQLNVSDNIEAMVSGSGSIKHKGNTKTVLRKIYGSGTIDRAY